MAEPLTCSTRLRNSSIGTCAVLCCPALAIEEEEEAVPVGSPGKSQLSSDVATVHRRVTVPPGTVDETLQGVAIVILACVPCFATLTLLSFLFLVCAPWTRICIRGVLYTRRSNSIVNIMAEIYCKSPRGPGPVSVSLSCKESVEAPPVRWGLLLGSRMYLNTINFIYPTCCIHHHRDFYCQNRAASVCVWQSNFHFGSEQSVALFTICGVLRASWPCLGWAG